MSDTLLHFTNTTLSQSQNNVADLVLEISNDLNNKMAVMVYFLLYDLVCKSKNQEHTITISHEQIATRLKISVRSSARAIRLLRAKGYIDAYQLKNTGKKYEPNTIRIKHPEHWVYRVFGFREYSCCPFNHRRI